MNWSFSEPIKIIIDFNKQTAKIYYSNKNILKLEKISLDKEQILKLILNSSK